MGDLLTFFETSDWGEKQVRESSFNMTRGGGDEDIEGGLRKFLDARRGGYEKIVALGGGGGSENLYTSKSTHDIIIISCCRCRHVVRT